MVRFGGMLATAQARVGEALSQLEEYGLLLIQDPLLPCVTRIVAGGAIRGTWLAHPLAHETYAVLVALEDHPDVLHTKLLAGKVTMVHRRLWPSVLAVAVARSPWQLQGLSPGAKWLLEEVNEVTSVQTDLLHLPLAIGNVRGGVPNVARELERRLLVHATEVHTPSGRHAKVLQAWTHWLSVVDPDLLLPPEPAARALLSDAVARLNTDFGASATLPWGR
jgi:hypothetical protein